MCGGSVCKCQAEIPAEQMSRWPSGFCLLRVEVSFCCMRHSAVSSACSEPGWERWREGTVGAPTFGLSPVAPHSPIPKIPPGPPSIPFGNNLPDPICIHPNPHRTLAYQPCVELAQVCVRAGTLPSRLRNADACVHNGRAHSFSSVLRVDKRGPTCLDHPRLEQPNPKPVTSHANGSHTIPALLFL